MKGLGSEKLLLKNQQKKLERLLEANGNLKRELDLEEAALEEKLRGRRA